MGFKPKSAQQEDQLDRLAKPEPPPAKKANMPVSKGPVPMQPDGEPSSVWPMLQDIRTRLQNIETLLRTQVLQENRKPTKAAEPVVDDTHPPAYPVTTNGGHPVLANGRPAPFIEVPSVEQLLARAKAYSEKHGREALAALVQEFEVKKISQLDDEQRAKFMERLG